MLYFDIDRFKVVNDSLGHNAGDMLLVEVAARVRSVMRGGNDLLARFGGDEFTMLARPAAQQHRSLVHRRAGRGHVRRAVPRRRPAHHRLGEHRHRDQRIDPAETAESLVSHADVAQYRAKQAGRNRIEVFDTELADAIQRRLDDEHELRAAIANGEICAWFQPEVELATGRDRRRPRRSPAGTIPPAVSSTRARFAPLAEESGLIFALDDHVVADARRRPASRSTPWRSNRSSASGATSRPVSSPAPNRPDASPISSRGTGCDPQMIGIEITETAIFTDLDAAARELAAARGTRHQIALDDFGTGYSSLNLLRSLPIDKVKIDQTFVRDIAHSDTDAAIVASLVTVADRLGITVVAEGVETPEQVQALIGLGCRYAQGFLYAKAIPVNELTARLLTNTIHAPA